MIYEDWQADILAEVQAQTESPVLHWMHGVRFISRSKGRGRSTPPRQVTLLQFGNGRHWRLWTGEDRQDGGRCPWDQWATEMGYTEAQQARDEFERIIEPKKHRF